MLKFYLGNALTENHRIYVNTNSSITEIAGSFDLGTIDLIWNTCELPIFPNTKLSIVDDATNEKWFFIVNQDDVEIANKNGTINYIHHLTISQNTHLLNLPLLRNTVFSQPYATEKKVNVKSLFRCDARYEDGVRQEFDNTTEFASSFNVNPPDYMHFSISARLKSDIKAVYFIPNTTIVPFTTFSYSGTSPNETVVASDPDDSKIYTNNKIGTINFKIYSGALEHISLSFTNADLGKKVYLTTQQINWLWEHRTDLYVKFIDNGTIDANIVFDDPSGTRTGWCPVIAGLISLDFHFDMFNFSLYDVLDIIEKQCEKIRNGITNNAKYYEMPSRQSTQGRLLASIKAPEIDLTGVDLFTAAQQVLSYIDAYPTLDENNVLGFVYLNDLSSEKVSTITKADMKKTLNEENFTNRLVVNYQNAKQENSVTYPAKNQFRKVGSDKYGVVGKNDYWFLTDKPIDYIDKLLIKSDTPISVTYRLANGDIGVGRFFQIAFTDFPYEFENNAVDISAYVFESAVYSQLPEQAAYTGRINKNTCLYYSNNDNKIYAGITDKIGLLSIVEQDVILYTIQNALIKQTGGGSVNFTYTKSTLKYMVEYHAIFDGRVAQESSTNKAEGDTIISQSNAGGELKKMGNNLQGLIAKLGTEQRTVTLPITLMKDRIKVGTIWEDENGNNWFVNKVKTSFLTDGNNVIVDATFTKDFNALQQFTTLDQEKRFYDISTKLTTKGYENINEYLYFTNRNIDVSELASYRCSFKTQAFKSMLGATFGETTAPLMETFESPIISTYDVGSQVSADVNTSIPYHVFGSGNMICFEMGFESPLNAGDRIVVEDDKIINKTFLYTKEHGFADKVDIKAKATYNITVDNISYPLAPTFVGGVSLFELTDYYYYKKPNEIFHLNYGIAFLPHYTSEVDSLGTPNYRYDEIFFGDSLINENAIIPNNKYGSASNRVFHLWVSNEKYSLTDKQAFGTDLGVCDVAIWYSNSILVYGELTAMINNVPQSLTNYASWCIADENKNLYISVNKREDGFTTTKLKFFLNKVRMESVKNVQITNITQNGKLYYKIDGMEDYEEISTSVKVPEDSSVSYYIYPDEFYKGSANMPTINNPATITVTQDTSLGETLTPFTIPTGTVSWNNHTSVVISLTNSNNFAFDYLETNYSTEKTYGATGNRYRTITADIQRSIPANSTRTFNPTLIRYDDDTINENYNRFVMKFSISGRDYQYEWSSSQSPLSITLETLNVLYDANYNILIDANDLKLEAN